MSSQRHTARLVLKGHIIDSMTLPQIMDLVMDLGGNFTIEELKVGQHKTDTSLCRMEVVAASAEKPKKVLIGAIAEEMKQIRQTGGRIVVVAGPAVVHTGAGRYLSRLIELGYVQILFAGNALAVHDVESALFGTALGVNVESGLAMEHGHEHHMRAINRVRAAGGLRQMVESGQLRSGVMKSAIEHGVDIVLAGSVRDDGPLPDVITDMVEAQGRMRAALGGFRIALMLSTMLHSIATGNMLPAGVRTVCVDINPAVVTKLADRGSWQSVGLVTDVESFLRELALVVETGRHG